MSFSNADYAGQSMRNPLRLYQPNVAGLFVHELLYELQYRHGRSVRRQGFYLQCQWLFQWINFYFYSCTGRPRELLTLFGHASVEPQGQMWQDCVAAMVAGHPLPFHAWLLAAVRAERLRRRL